VGTSAFQQLRGQPTGPFLYWTFVILVLLIVGRQLLTVLDNQALNRRLAAMVGELEHQAFHDGLTHLPNRALFRERPPFLLQGRQVQVGASVGVTVSEASEVDAVLREADVAMYTAKARGKGRFELAVSSL
jgi:GGDEF domain-containing protein